MSVAVPTPSGRDRALRYVREEVLTDPAVQGTFVNEQELATRIGVSRTPVREALLIVASEGLVQMLPKRGAYVPPLSSREITELMDLRGLLERHAITQSLRLDRSPHHAMSAILATQRQLASTSDEHEASAFIELDRQFHQSLVDAASNALLSRTYAGLRERQVRVGVAALQQGESRWDEVCTEHTVIVDALADGDVEAAHRAVDDHLAITLRTLLAV